LMPGWRRDIRAQRFGWRPDGAPDFGTPVPAGVPLPIPSGECATH
jgi:GH43 family beta-xylosidase